MMRGFIVRLNFQNKNVLTVNCYCESKLYYFYYILLKVKCMRMYNKNGDNATFL